jgi:hypothetical protein
MHIGATGGYAASITKEGVAGFGDTSLGKSKTYGADLGYRFGSGLKLGVRVEQLRLGVRESGLDLGTLAMRPVLVTVGYQGMPAKGRGFTGHGQFGGGVALSRFTNGPAIVNLERATGARLETTTRTSPAFELGGGVDYFVTRQVSLTTDFRVLLSNVGTQFTAVGVRRVPIDGIDKFFASNAQVLAGVRIWFR